MPYKLAQLVINPERKAEILSRIFTSQPSMEEEQILGKLFVLVEIRNQKTDIMLANFIIDRMNLFYYQNEQVPLLARLATVTVNDIFENSLAKLNQEIVNFTQTEKLSFNPQDFNLTIGVIFKNKLYFSGIGHNKALLIYKSKTRNNRQVNDYNLLNITASTADPTQEVVLDNKLFTNTISGSIPPEGYIFFANESLYEFLSEKQLIKIITTLPPAGAAEQIKNILEQTNIYMPFTGLIIKNQHLAKPTEDWRTLVVDPRVKAEPSPVHHTLEPSRHREQEFRQERDLNKESIRALNRTAAKTAQILRPPGFVSLDRIRKFLKKLPWPTAGQKQNKLIVKRSDLSWLKRESLLSLKNLWSGLVKIASIVLRLGAGAVKLLADRQERQAVAVKVTGWRARLNKKHLIILGTAVFCLLAFLASLYFTGVQKNNRAREAAWSDASAQFNTIFQNIGVDLSYDKNKAELDFSALAEPLNRLIANAGSKHQPELADFKNRYQTISDQLSGLIRLGTVDKVWTLPEGQSADALGLTNNRLYLASAAGQNLLQFNLADKTSQTIVSHEPDLKLLNTDSDGNVFCLGQNKLIIIDKAGQVATKPIAGLTAAPTAAAVYNNNLYAFDAANRQIYRYQGAGTLANPAAWLLGPFEGDNVSDLAVADGSIFLLAGNQIFKYTRGTGGPLALDSIIPAITQAKKMTAATLADVLAVLDQPTKRLIVFSRATGKLLSQYTSENWNDFKGLALEANGKTAYLLNGQDIYKIPLK